MEKILKDKSTEGKFSKRDQIHFFIMFMVLLIYATGFNFIGSHLWGCFVGGLSFTSVPHSHHLWVAQTKRSVKWMIRIFFACTVGFSIPIAKLLTAKSFGYGMIIGAIPCLAAKVFCAQFMGDARWVIGWGMCGRAEFAYYIAAGALTSLLMSKEVYAITIWSLLCATIIAPFAFRFVLQKYTKKLEMSHRSTFVTLPEDVQFKVPYDEQGDSQDQVVVDASQTSEMWDPKQQGGTSTAMSKDMAHSVLPVIPTERDIEHQTTQTDPWMVQMQIYPYDTHMRDGVKLDTSVSAQVEAKLQLNERNSDQAFSFKDGDIDLLVKKIKEKEMKIKETW